MSSPKVLVQIFMTGSKILGKAFFEAGRQAVKNAKHNPAAAGGVDVAGVGRATSGSPSDMLTVQHRMTLDEANLILNAKKGESLEGILKNYEHLFKANSPPAPPEKPVKPVRGRAPPPPAHSHYIQSKVVRARERIEAEMKLGTQAEVEAAAEAPAQAPNTSAPPPPEAKS